MRFFDHVSRTRAHIQEIILPDKGGSQPGFGITPPNLGGWGVVLRIVRSPFAGGEGAIAFGVR
jgi:hypothetical protein